MAKELHKNMLARVVNAPVNLFFDVTPLAKLLDNFTGDLSGIDRALFYYINLFISSVIDCLIKMGIALYFSPVMIVAMAMNLYFLHKIQNYTMAGKDAIVQLCHPPRRRILSRLQEDFSGLTVIRAFEKQDEFIDSMNEVTDTYMKVITFYYGSSAFYRIRLFFLSNCMFCCSGVLCIYLRGSYAPLTLALLFQLLEGINDKLSTLLSVGG